MKKRILPIVELLKIKGDWREVADLARNTIRMSDGTGEPSSSWKRRILMSEHSPIRTIFIKWRWNKLMQWVHVHFIRHKYGIEHWVSTQREDVTGVDRDTLLQADPVTHIAEANLQEILFISRKRLCFKASPETREAWKLVLNEIKDLQPELFSMCVPECVYRNGLCPEMKTCKWNQTPEFEEALAAYLKGFEMQVSKYTSIQTNLDV